MAKEWGEPALGTETVTTETLQIVVFSLLDENSKAKEDYGIEVENVREIRPLENTTRLPNAADHVRGVMNLRGKIISVIDVKKKLGFAGNGETGAKSRILIAEVGGILTGLLVDEVSEVMRISANDVESGISGDSKSAQYIKGVAKIEERLIILLDIQKFLAEIDDQQIEKPTEE